MLAGAIASLQAAAASAQTSDVVVMRRVLAPPTKKMTGTTPSYYSWQTTPWTQSGTCGQQGTETRGVSCVRTDGTTVDDSMCTGNGSGARPVTSQPVVVTQSCGYAWQAGSWNSTPSTCGTTVLTRDVSCIRSDGVVSDASLCSGSAKPASSEQITDYSGCAFQWSASDWSAPSTTCGQASETRTVVCQRSDGATVADPSCVNAGTKPASSQTLTETTGCTAYWNIGAWGPTAPACGASSQSRTVTCLSGSGAALTDQDCADANAGDKPATTRPANSQATCTYSWTPGAWSDPGQACGDVQETRTISCHDSSGADADAALCTQHEPTSTRTVHVTTSCTYSWTAGGFGSPQPACGPTVAMQSVSCTRSDGQTVADGSCDPATRPAASEAATDYSSCTFAWASGPWSDWTSTCGSATQSRIVTCQRADGVTVDDSQCSGDKPGTTQSSYQTTGCGYTWQSSAWSVTPACGATTETRYNSCLRSDGQPADSSSCAASGAAPATSQATTDYSTCTFGWSVGDWSGPSTTCGQATQTRAVTCQRSDGTTATDDQCASAGAKPDATQTTLQTSGCSYAWTSNPWSNPVPACGATTQTRTNTCMRSDGTAVDASLCTSPQPSTSQATTDYSTCSYTWQVSQWSQAGVCGVSATQTRTVTCQRSNGDTVADSLCTSSGQGAKPASSQTVTDYSGCSYAWQDVNGTWSSTCSATATRTNTVTCQRSDKVTVDNSYCDAGSKPATTDTGNFAGCTYTGTYGNPSTCVASGSSGTQTVTLTQCTRSDGTVVANSSCSPASKSQTCTPPNTSTQYSRQPSGVVDPSTVSGQSTAYNDHNLTTSSAFGVSVSSTLCWDSTNNTTSASSTCSSLTAGANVYDIVDFPATYVSDLHEVYVNQSDITAAMPHVNSFLSYSVAGACAGNASVNVYSSVGGARQSWSFRCGTPDSGQHYLRQPQYLEDPYALSGEPAASKTVNTSSGSTLSLAVRATSCWDTNTNAAASSTNKCNYLPSGANIYDLVGISATYVSGLREVYVAQSDLQAAEPHGSSIFNSSDSPTGISTACSSGTSMAVYVGGVAQIWTMWCGTPDNAGHYARMAQYMQDPSSLSGVPAASKTVNTSTSSTLSLAVRGTECWDTTANAQAADAKCQYLASGDNLNDMKTIPATYEPNTREVYVAQADLQSMEVHGYIFFDRSGNTSSISTLCTAGSGGGMALSVYVGGVAQGWTLRCGTPDPSSYARYATMLGDPYIYYSTNANRTVNNPANPLLYIDVASIGCWNTTTSSQAAYTAKCTYATSGPNANDLVNVPATWNTTAKTVTVRSSDILATNPYTQASAYSTTCGRSFNVSGVSYSVVCQ